MNMMILIDLLLLFQGITCELDVNECGIYAGTDLGCQNGATCVNSQGGFR